MSRPFLIGILTLANVFAWSVPVPHGLSVSFLDVGHGRAVVIHGPSGAVVLADGGPDSSVLREIGQTLPFFVRSLDAVIATDADAADIGGLPGVLSRYTVGAFIESGIPSDTKAAAALESAADTFHAKRITAHGGMRVMLGKGAYADVLSPEEGDKDGPVAMRVVYGRTSFLLPADADKKIQKRLSVSGQSRTLQSTVLQVPHYGSKDSLSPEFLHAVVPQYAVISYGCGNRWGYPAPETLRAFTDAGTRVFGTCEKGTVTFVSDGKTLRLAER